MAIEPQYIEPKSLTIGERQHWRKSFPDHPATLYSLEYRFRGPTGLGVDQAATAYNSDFDIVLPVTKTETMKAELYRYQVWLTEIADSTNTFLMEQGTIRVDVGFEAANDKSIDLRTSSETILAALEATMAGKATTDQLGYRIQSGAGEREIRRMSFTELIEAIKFYSVKVASEANIRRVNAGGSMFKNYLIHSKEA